MGGPGGGPGDGNGNGGVPTTNAPPVNAPFADNGTVLNVLPPGQDDNGGIENAALPIPDGVIENSAQDLLGAVVTSVAETTPLVPALDTESHFDDQLALYDRLVHSPEGLTNSDLVGPQQGYFKPEDMRGPDDGPWESTSTVSNGDYEVTIKRGAEYGVPHIFGGDSRENALFGTGYVTAADRLFLLDVLRRAGRGELSQFLGPADFSFDEDIARGAPYREADRERQIQATADKLGDTGDQVLRDLDAFVAGLNEYVAQVKQTTQPVDAVTTKLPIEYLALGVSLEPFTRADIHAVATLIQSIFAVGGGGEADNLRLLHALQDQVQDKKTACRLWRDIRHALDPASSVTVEASFATQSPRNYDDDICPLDPEFASQYPGAAVFDAGSYQAYDPLTREKCGRPGRGHLSGADQRHAAAIACDRRTVRGCSGCARQYVGRSDRRLCKQPRNPIIVGNRGGG